MTKEARCIAFVSNLHRAPDKFDPSITEAPLLSPPKKVIALRLLLAPSRNTVSLPLYPHRTPRLPGNMTNNGIRASESAGAISAVAMATIVKRLRRSAATVILKKPFCPQTIAAKIHEIINVETD